VVVTTTSGAQNTVLVACLDTQSSRLSVRFALLCKYNGCMSLYDIILQDVECYYNLHRADVEVTTTSALCVKSSVKIRPFLGISYLHK
jgi:hypothetical protein